MPAPVIPLMPMPSAESATPMRPQRRRHPPQSAAATRQAPTDVVGLWTSADGFVRHALLDDGRYTESRGSRRDVYRGHYVLHGTRIDYVDDGGLFAFGELVDGALHLGGRVLRRAPADPVTCPLPPLQGATHASD